MEQRNKERCAAEPDQEPCLSRRQENSREQLKNQFDPRKPQDRPLTNERVSALVTSVMENIPSACVLYSIEHTKDDGLPEPLPQKALTFMASKEMKGKPLEQTAPLFLKNCQMTKDQVARVEVETRGQSTNELWYQQRFGRVTVSNFHTFHTKAQPILNRKGHSDKKPVADGMAFQLLKLTKPLLSEK